MPYPKGSKGPKYGVSMVSILGIIMMVLGRYLIVEYLDPEGILFPEGPSTQYLRTLIVKIMALMVFGTKVLKC